MGPIFNHLSQGEREGPAAKRWEGEGVNPRRLSPSPSHAAHGPLPLPLGEVVSGGGIE